MLNYFTVLALTKSKCSDVWEHFSRLKPKYIFHKHINLCKLRAKCQVGQGRISSNHTCIKSTTYLIIHKRNLSLHQVTSSAMIPRASSHNGLTIKLTGQCVCAGLPLDSADGTRTMPGSLYLPLWQRLLLSGAQVLGLLCLGQLFALIINTMIMLWLFPFWVTSLQ